MLRDALGEEPDEHSESDEESNCWADSGAPPRGEPGTAAARDGLTEVPCGCGIRNVPSDEDGVPEAEADDEQDEDVVVVAVVVVLQDALLLFVRLDRLSSKPNRGNGSDIGRSTESRADRSLRGSVGGSSFSSKRGVPGRLLPSCRLLRVEGASTSKGMMRGRECLVADELAVPSPELSVERRETLRLGRLKGCNGPPLFASLVGVDDGVVLQPTADGADDELDVRPAIDEAWMLDGRGSLVLTSLTPLSLLPLNFDFFFLAFFDFFDAEFVDLDALPPAGLDSTSETCSSSPELLATPSTRSSLKSRMRVKTSDPLAVGKVVALPVSILNPLLLLLPPLP